MPKVTPERDLVYGGVIYTAGAEVEVDAETAQALKAAQAAPDGDAGDAGDDAPRPETGADAQHPADAESKPARGRKAD